jgi:hypothetical protein
MAVRGTGGERLQNQQVESALKQIHGKVSSFWSGVDL